MEDKLTVEQAIARQEGFPVPGTRANRNCNPGNINWGVFARLHGSTGPDSAGYAIFPSAEIGAAALKALLKTAAYKGHSLRDVLMRYCPPEGDSRGANDTDEYIENVAKWTGIDPSESIDQYV